MSKPFSADLRMRIRLTDETSEVFPVDAFTDSTTRSGWRTMKDGTAPGDLYSVVKAITKKPQMTFIRRFNSFTQSLVDARKSKTALPEVRFTIVVWYHFYTEEMKKIDADNAKKNEFNKQMREHLERVGLKNKEPFWAPTNHDIPPLAQRMLYSTKGLYLSKVKVTDLNSEKGADVVTITAEKATETENFQHCQVFGGVWSRMPCYMLGADGALKGEIAAQPSLGPDSLKPPPPPPKLKPMTAEERKYWERATGFRR